MPVLTVTTRLTVWYFLVTGGMIAALSTAMYLKFADDERATVDAQLVEYASFLTAQVGPQPGSPSDLYSEIQEVAARANVRSHGMRFMLATRDSIIYDPLLPRPLETLVDSLDNLDLHLAPGGYRTISAGEIPYRAYRQNVIPRAGDTIGVVVVTPIDRVESRIQHLRNLLLIVIPLSVLVSSAGGWLIVRRALKPVGELRSAAERISGGDLSQRVSQPASRDEIAALARTFNEMIERLEVAFASQRRFIADASHDLRTPLMVIESEVDRLRSRAAQYGVPPEEIGVLAREAKRLSAIVNDLLLLARADAHRLSPRRDIVALDALLIDVAAALQPLATERSITLNLEIGEPISIVGDGQQLERALRNIVDNAICYTGEGGHVLVSLAATSGVARIIVQDNGPGISDKDMPRVFDRFYRGDRSRSHAGSGLGLAISRTIVESHGGRLLLESAPERGTTATIDLPQ